jgi:hypothetical protein
MPHSPQIVAAAEEAKKTFWSKHGVQSPLQFFGFCLSLVPIPGLQQAGQALDRHLQDKAQQAEFAKIWSAIEAQNTATGKIADLEEAIAEVARTVAANPTIQGQLESFLGMIGDGSSGFRVITKDQSFQSLVDTVVTAERAVVDASGGSTNVLQNVRVNSADTLLRATTGSANYISNSSFGDATGSVAMQGIRTQGDVRLSGPGLSLYEGAQISMGEGSQLTFGAPANPLLLSLTCPRCNQSFTCARPFLRETRVRCPSCQLVALPPT